MEKIRTCLSNIDWDEKFNNSHVDEMVKVFTSAVIEFVTRYIPHKIIKIDDRDPPWITCEIKTAVKRKHRVFNKYVKRGRKPEHWEYVKLVRNATCRMITNARETYFQNLGKKLSDPSNGIKAYWSTLNKIINRKKTSNIPPLLENGIFVTNFQNKADIFNDLFVKQCSELDNGSKLPPFRAKCMEAFETVDIDSAKVLQTIRSLDCNKAHGWDDISIVMSKMCDYAVVPPLCLIYVQCLETGSYPQTWKMANVLPVHKKESTQMKTNYRPISLLPICGKIFEKLMFEYLCFNNLLTPNQSGFRPGDSTINQLISITHSIYTAFEEFPSRETRAVFLDISKAFDTVWHEGLLFKLKSNGIIGSLIELISAFLTD